MSTSSALCRLFGGRSLFSIAARAKPLHFLYHRDPSLSYFATMSTMDFKYKCAIEALNSLQSNQASIEQRRLERHRHPERGLLQTAACLRLVGITPEHLNQLRVVHVAGTKGKGSTCALVESLLRAHGLRTGFFSSPHLVAARERIRLDGRPISAEAFTTYFWEVYDRLERGKDEEEPMPMYFMFLTVLSLYVFVRERMDVAVMEVGIGGAFDCTNVIRNPAVCGITHLDYDHTAILGSRIEQIAEQKAGIIKPGVPVFVGQQRHAATLPVVADRAAQCQSALRMVPELDEYLSPEGGRPQLGLAGQFQRQNASLALQLVRYWRRTAGGLAACLDAASPVPEGTLARAQSFQLTETEACALADCRWPGRCQVVVRGAVEYLLDGAHTAGSVSLALRWFQQETSRTAGTAARTVLLFYSTGARDPEELLSSLANAPWDDVVFCPSVAWPVQDATSDTANLAVGAGEHQSRVEAHCQAWRAVATSPAAAAARIHRFCCISDAVNYIEDAEVPFTQVFAVGSLHLVGGLLSIIDPDLSSVAPAAQPRGQPDRISAPAI